MAHPADPPGSGRVPGGAPRPPATCLPGPQALLRAQGWAIRDGIHRWLSRRATWLVPWSAVRSLGCSGSSVGLLSGSFRPRAWVARIGAFYSGVGAWPHVMPSFAGPPPRFRLGVGVEVEAGVPWRAGAGPGAGAGAGAGCDRRPWFHPWISLLLTLMSGAGQLLGQGNTWDGGGQIMPPL